MIVTGDEGVAGWARARGLQTLDEGEHSRGLDGAAAAAAAHSQNLGVRWAILHADLPLVSPADLHAVFTTEGPAIAPSHDGGTNVLVGSGVDFTFSYGPASFHRHLACKPGAAVVTRPGLALDLDTPRDFRRALRSRSGAGLTDLVSAS